MRNALHAIILAPNYLLIVPIRLYQKTLSPDHGMMSAFFPYGACRHSPTCSQYAVEKLKTHLLPIALIKILQRVIHCNPFTKVSDKKLRSLIAKL